MSEQIFYERHVNLGAEIIPGNVLALPGPLTRLRYTAFISRLPLLQSSNNCLNSPQTVVHVVNKLYTKLCVK